MAVYPLDSSIPISTPFKEKIQFKTSSSRFGLLGKEHKKRFLLFPRRELTLVYENRTKAQAQTLWAFYIARSGGFEVFTYFYATLNTYVKEYVGTGDGSTTDFDTPSFQGTSISVYVDDVLKTGGGTDYTFTSEGGSDGGDEISFNSAPSSGAKITISFTGYYRLRARFAEDIFDFDTFYRVLTSTGIVLQGVLNDE